MRLPTPMRRFPWFSPDEWLHHFTEPPPSPVESPPPRLGLVLSCGGARGLAHVGVIQVLERENIPISAIIGSSMGAYVGALWSAGFNGTCLEELAREIKDRRTLLRLVDPVIPPFSGFLYGHKVRKHLERSLGARTISQLERPMYIVATNLDTLRGEVLPQDTPVAAAVHASCAIPGIVAPVDLNGSRYIDGGAAQPLPVRLLRHIMGSSGLPSAGGSSTAAQAPLDAIIAVTVMPSVEDIASSPGRAYPAPPPVPATFWSRLRTTTNQRINLFADGNVLDTFKRCLTSAQLRLISEESNLADVLIHPYVVESRWYDFEKFDRYIEAGRTAAEAALPRIMEVLQSPTATTRAAAYDSDKTLVIRKASLPTLA